MRAFSAAAFLIVAISTYGGADVSGTSPADGHDKRLDIFTRYILRTRGFEKEKEDAIVQSVIQSARKDPTLDRSIQFTANALGLINGANKEGNLFKFLSKASSDAPWDAIEKMGELYRSQGELPAVRYAFGRNNAVWLSKFADDYQNSADIEGLNGRYANLRKNGFRPDEVYEFLMGKGWSNEVKSGFTFTYAQLRDLGEASITGYGHEDAEKDLAAYLEAHYATVYPNAKDIGSVAKAVRPMDFIAMKLLTALKSDLARMRKATDAAIQTALAQIPSREIPSISAPPRGEFKLPNLDGIGSPGAQTNLEKYWWNSTTTTSTGYSNFRFKAEMPDSNTYIAKYLAEGAATRPRGFTADFHGVYPAAGTHFGSTSLKPNRSYEMVLYPWYFAETYGSAYFFGGNPNRGWNYDIEGPPAEGRAYLPASRGGIVEVRVPFRTDAGGRFRIVCMQPGPGAIAFGKVFIRELK